MNIEIENNGKVNPEMFEFFKEMLKLMEKHNSMNVDIKVMSVGVSLHFPENWILFSEFVNDLNTITEKCHMKLSGIGFDTRFLYFSL